MKKTNFLTIKVVATALLVFAIIVLAVYANEARKEVYYLCANFKEGDILESVISQLETSNLSTYKIVQPSKGQHIVFSSKLNFNYFRCNIHVNQDGKVVSVKYN